MRTRVFQWLVYVPCSEVIIPFYYKVVITRNQFNQLVQYREFVAFYVLRKTLIASESNNNKYLYYCRLLLAFLSGQIGLTMPSVLEKKILVGISSFSGNLKINNAFEQKNNRAL